MTGKHDDACSCSACIAEEMDYDDSGEGCANCGGEGFTYGCSWDWQCDTYDAGEGTCLCTRRCDWCNPVKRAPSEPEPYRPSNGTEGEAFMARWCYQCADLGGTGDVAPCPILGDTLAGLEVPQWRQDGPAGPRCTAFRESPDDPGPLDPAAVVRPLL